MQIVSFSRSLVYSANHQTEFPLFSTNFLGKGIFAKYFKLKKILIKIDKKLTCPEHFYYSLKIILSPAIYQY